MLSLITWKPEDSFNVNKLLYNNLKLDENIIDDGLSQIEQISANRQAFK